jgi:hypothetical protein
MSDGTAHSSLPRNVSQTILEGRRGGLLGWERGTGDRWLFIDCLLYESPDERDSVTHVD